VGDLLNFLGKKIRWLRVNIAIKWHDVVVFLVWKNGPKPIQAGH
jgi:hypothetical protein